MTNSDCNILLSTDKGFFEGDRAVPFVYEGSAVDRIFWHGPRLHTNGNARLVLTDKELIVDRFFTWSGKKIRVELDSVVAVYQCGTDGGKWWGKNVLKILYLQDGQSRVLAIVVMGLTCKQADEWKRQLEERIPVENARLLAPKETIRRLRFDNICLLAANIGTFVLLGLSFVPHLRLFLVIIAILLFMMAQTLYNRRFNYPGCMGQPSRRWTRLAIFGGGIFILILVCLTSLHNSK